MHLSQFEQSNPFDAVVLENERITDLVTDEIRHITLGIRNPAFDYVEGQSIAVHVPGPHVFGNQEHVRLYSIASSRQGEKKNLAEISICVRRCFYIDEFSGERYPGIASNYLCERGKGDKIQITGPYGRNFQAPKDNSSNILMVGIGTGIAPFRAFLKHIYEDRGEWQGKVRLFYGAKSGLDLLYMNNENDDLHQYYDEQTFKAIQALSPNPHLDDPIDMLSSLKSHTKEVWEMIQDKNTYVYLSGLKELEHVFDEAMGEMAGSCGAWENLKDKLIGDRRISSLFYD